MEEIKKEEAPKKKRKLMPWILSGIVVVLAGLTWLFYDLYHYVGTNDATIDGFYVNVSSEVLGRVTKLFVDEGDTIAKDQLICQIDDTILLSQKEEAEANIETLKNKVLFQEIYVKKIEDDYWRGEKAITEHVISAQDFDHLKKDFEMAKALLLVARAELAQAKKELEVILARLKQTVVFSPRNGVIAKRWILSGDVINASQPIFSLYDIRDVWVIANLEETKVAHVKIGDPVDIHVDAYRGHTFHGKVFAILGAAASQFSLIPQDNATGNYTKVEQRIPIKISIESEPSLYLFPGMSVEVKIRVR